MCLPNHQSTPVSISRRGFVQRAAAGVAVGAALTLRCIGHFGESDTMRASRPTTDRCRP